MNSIRSNGGCIIAVVLLLATSGCAQVSEGKPNNRQEQRRQRDRQQIYNPSDALPEETVRLSAAEESAIDLATSIAEQRPIHHRLAAMGKVLADPNRVAIVSYAFPARVAKLHVSIGDWVTAGQNIVTLQSEEVGNAKADFYEAEAGLELKQANHERELRLHERGVGAKKDLLAEEAELKVAMARLEVAEKKLHLLGFSEAQVRDIAQTHQINPEITLFAPVSGKAARIDAVRGAMVDQGHEILLILDPTHLVVDAEVYERDIASVHVKQDVEITVPAFPSEQFNGNVSYIGDLVDESTHTITVRTRVENSNGKLKPGMFANVNIVLAHRTDAVVVPVSAVISDSQDHQLVFVAVNNDYEAREVETGLEVDGVIEIVDGLTAGEEVVSYGAYQLNSKLRAGLLSAGHSH